VRETNRSSKFKRPNVLQEIDESIDSLIASLERRIDSAVGPDHLLDVDELILKYSTCLVFKCFYKQDNLIDFDDPNEVWTRSAEVGFAQVQENFLVALSVIFPVFKSLIDWLVWHFTPVGFIRRKLLEFVKLQTLTGLKAREQLRELKRAAEEQGTRFDPENFVLKDGTRFRRNMVDHIIDQYLDGKMTKSQYLCNSCFLIAAADKTAADCLVYTIYLLSVNKCVQDKLRASIRTDGEESEYLDWVLKESLRLRPPAPTGCSRSVARDMLLDDGHVVPAGTLVITNAYVIHRLKQYWGDDADEFKPERWHDTSHHHPMQYMPFGAGPRGCPGRMFAMFEMKRLLVALMSRYEFQAEPHERMEDFDSPFWIFVLPKHPTMVKIRRLP
jgi:hypothetical protein